MKTGKWQRLAQYAFTVIAILALGYCAAAPPVSPAAARTTNRLDAAGIVSRSVAANAADWNAAPQYDFTERDRVGAGTRTYRVTMILGSPYQELTEVNGKPLSTPDRQRERRNLEEVVSKRRAESAADRSARIADYERDRKRDRLMMLEITRAFDFKLLGEGRLGGYAVYRLQATPRAGYQPPNLETEVLPGMRGSLWVDKQTYQWVRVEAEVVHPVSIVGFLARVLPGTHFELDERPVAEGIWLPSHFTMKSNARILWVFPHRTQADETYFNYEKAGGALQ